MRQIGHLPELYEDARSEKYKILQEECQSICGETRQNEVHKMKIDDFLNLRSP